MLVIGYYYISSTKDVYEFNDFSEDIEKDETIQVANETEEMIIIHVTGAVKSEGIVKVKENARINDVIEAAGGITEDADLGDVNLAYEVQDGQKIYIPSKEDREETDDGEIVSSTAGEKVLEEETKGSGSALVNINTASQEKLTELPGIRKFNSIKNYHI